jgi:O-methyltransferase
MNLLNRWAGPPKFAILEPRLAILAWQQKRKKTTFLSWSKLLSLVESFHLIRKRFPGKALHLSEFGVGRGGSALLLGWLAGRYDGSIALFDVFGRIPAPTAADGEQARIRYEKILHLDDNDYYGNIPNLQELVLSELSKVCPRQRIEIIPGRYEDVLPVRTGANVFDLVHIDCDWYESSRVVLAYLKDRLSPGAILQIDDYGHWQGSRQAFDEAGWLKRYQTRQVDDALLVDTGLEKQAI